MRHKSLLSQYLNSNINFGNNIYAKIDTKETETDIKPNKCNKAIGGDEIPPEFPQCNITNCAVIPTYLFNNANDTNMPDEWRTVIIVFISKKAIGLI